MILRTKNKLHRLINVVFYGITFLLGYLIGGGRIENIKTIFSQFFN